MKKYIFLAASALTLASCSSDDFLGDTPGSTPTSANSAIKFDGNAGKISRTTSNTGSAPEMLGKEFKIYGVKSGATSGTDYNPVFKDYLLWYDDANKNTTTNKSGWEYVGTAGTHGSATLNSNQTIKFWDYASADYRFVAGAPSTAFTFTPGTNNTLESATITGLSGHITANTESGTDPKTEPNPVYVAKPVVVSSDNYKQPVTFTFVRHQTKVRVGIYETIPGYKISSISFYPYEENSDAFSSTSSQNIILTTTTAGYFKGGSIVSGKINYDWNEPKYTFEYETTGLTQSKNWYGGKFANGVPATVSTEAGIENLYGTDADMESNGYFTVLPTPSTTEAKPILIKCDYTLESIDGSEETIEVKGATAAIPAAYSKWNTNTLYTYLFKISENTNGFTGSDDPSHVGLYPITFDAAVKQQEFGTQGTITTFTTPSITTHQEGSVVENSGIKYVTGKDITVKVTKSTDGTDLTLSETADQNGYIEVYKFTDPITEAEAQVKGIETGEKVTDISHDTGKKVFTFKPDAEGYYVIRYLTKEENSSAVYTYKVVYVEEAAPATK